MFFEGLTSSRRINVKRKGLQFIGHATVLLEMLLVVGLSTVCLLVDIYEVMGLLNMSRLKATQSLADKAVVGSGCPLTSVAREDTGHGLDNWLQSQSVGSHSGL